MRQGAKKQQEGNALAVALFAMTMRQVKPVRPLVLLPKGVSRPRRP